MGRFRHFVDKSNLLPYVYRHKGFVTDKPESNKLNAKLITRTASNILIVSILTLVLMPASFAKRGGGGKPPPEPVETSCADAESESDFPAFAANNLSMDAKDPYQGMTSYFQIKTETVL